MSEAVWLILKGHNAVCSCFSCQYGAHTTGMLWETHNQKPFPGYFQLSHLLYLFGLCLKISLDTMISLVLPAHNGMLSSKLKAAQSPATGAEAKTNGALDNTQPVSSFVTGLSNRAQQTVPSSFDSCNNQ